MNEEQAVLEFFAKKENLPLALIAAEHLDNLRQQHNNLFWAALHARLDLLLSQTPAWHSALTEDRNSEGTVVGLHLQPRTEQRIFLRPFMEQQLTGDSYRIYYGLMWNSIPEPAQKSLPAVETLRARLSDAGFKQNDSFLAWQWSPWYPRRKDFLLRFANTQDELIEAAIQPWQMLLQEYGEQLRTANLELNKTPQSAVISLDQLHNKTGR